MDDEQIDDIPAKIGDQTCGKIAMGMVLIFSKFKIFQIFYKNSNHSKKVGDPVTWKKSGRMFGFWGRDSYRRNQSNLYIMEHFYRNTQIVEYARMVDFIKDKPSNNYTGIYLNFG